jgi:hypothetical protein
MNFSRRLPNACMRFNASLADSLTRFCRFILSALLSSGFLAMMLSRVERNVSDFHGIVARLPLPRVENIGE